jgi:DNA-binding MarR family transcriptional regulator
MGKSSVKTREKNSKSPAVATEVWDLMGQVFMTNKPAMMAVCREFDLFPPQMMVLRTLTEPKPMREVAKFLACDNSNLTGIIDRLEERDLVRRTVSEEDRRVKLLVLTEEGEKLRDEIVSRLSVPPELIASLPAADLRAMREILRRAVADSE